MRLSRAIEEFLQDVMTTNSRATADAYRSDLNRLLAMAGHDTVLGCTPELVSRYFRDLSESKLKMATLHRKAASLRQFFGWGKRQRIWGDDLLEAIPHIRRPETLPRPFTQDEAVRLWKLSLPPEERVLRSLLFYTGLRVSAVCAITIGDVSMEPPMIGTVTKGSKRVLKFLHPKAAEVVINYILSHTGLTPESPLLTRASGAALTRRIVERITHRWGARARVPACVPHRFRHTFATEQLRGGADIRVIQKAMDHKDIKSTAVYVKVHDEQVRDAILKLPESWGDTP